MACNPFEFLERFHNEQRYNLLDDLIEEYYDRMYFVVNVETRTIRIWNQDFGSLRWNQATNETEETPYEESTRTFYDFYLDFFKKDIELALKCVQENAAKGRFDFTEGCIKSFFHSIFRWGRSESYPDYYNSVLWIIGKVSAEAYHYSESPLVRDITDSIIGRLSNRGVKVKFEPAYERSVELPPQQESGTQGYGVKLKPGKTEEEFLRKLQKCKFVPSDTDINDFKKFLCDGMVALEKKIVWTLPTNTSDADIMQLVYLIHKIALPPDIPLTKIVATHPRIKNIPKFFKRPDREIRIDSSVITKYKKGKPRKYAELDLVIEEFIDLPSK
jgi:hypothetical protein